MESRGLVFFFLLSFLLAPAFAGTIPAGLMATFNLTNFTFATDFEADVFSARDYGIAINDSYLDVNTTYFLTINITNFTIDIYNFTANSTTATNPTNFTAKMRNAGIKYNLKVNGVYSQEVLTDSGGNATFFYNTWDFTPIGFRLTTCTESWTYADWSSCPYGYQTRTAMDSNSCGTAYNRSEISRLCSITAASGSSGGGGSGSFSEGTPSTKQLAFSFQTPVVLKILANVFYTLPEPQNVTLSYPASIPQFIPQAPGLAYSFLEIAQTFNSSRYLTQAQIDFKVNKTWYSKNGITPGSTALHRFDGQSWRSLPTVQTGEEPLTYSFAANTTSFSLFAITGTKSPKPTQTATITASPAATAAIIPVMPTPVGMLTSTQAVQPPPVPRPPLWWALPIVLLAILAAIAVYFGKSRPPGPPVKTGAQVAIKGIVTSRAEDGFECTDGTEFIFVKSDRKPPISSWVEVKGTLSRSGGRSYIAASSVREI